MKKIFFLFATILTVLIYPFTVFAVVSMDESVYVTDEAGIIKSDTEEYIIEYSKFIYEACGVKFFVVTTDNLESLSLEEYSSVIFDEYNLGDNSILILASKMSNTFRIQVGKGLSKVFPDDVIDKYIYEYMMPYFKNGEWDEGIKNGYSALYKRLCSAYNIDSSDMDVYNGNAFINKYKYVIISVITFIGTLLSNLFASFLIDIFKIKKKMDFFDMLILILSIAINIFFIVLLYVLVPKSVILMLVTELLVGYSSYSIYNETRVKKSNKADKKKSNSKPNKVSKSSKQNASKQLKNNSKKVTKKQKVKK